jgi:hypothetical protein
LQKTDSNQEFYLKGIYPVEVLSEAKDGLVEVRAKTTFLHTSAYADGKRQVRVGETQKRWVRKGEVSKLRFATFGRIGAGYRRDIFDSLWWDLNPSVLIPRRFPVWRNGGRIWVVFVFHFLFTLHFY